MHVLILTARLGWPPTSWQRGCLLKWHDLPCLSEPPNRIPLLRKRSICHEVGGQRGAVFPSDLPNSFWWFHEDGPSPTAASRTVQATFAAHGSEGEMVPPISCFCGIHRTLWVLSTFPCGPSPCPERCPRRSATMTTLLP
jgi:hypothetical protein